MDKTGRANGPYRRLKNAQQAEAIRRESPPLPMRGPYYSGMVDFPWASEPGAEGDQGGRAYWPYPTITPEQAAAMPVPSILQADASVWMWIPNFHLMHGCHLRIAAAWGLRPVALFTWVKKRWGNGQRARGATESADRRRPALSMQEA
jgi:N6-adenosine-specific RNA methylase IME4